MVDKQLFEVVLEAYKRSFSVQSDYARSYASLVAMAASLRLITTKVHNDIFSSQWRPTIKGLEWLEEHGVSVADEEWPEEDEELDD